MKQALPSDEWNIYNCHIHTFTKKHTPTTFIKFVLSDSRLGRINWFMIPVYLIGVSLYISFLFILGGYIGLLSTRFTVSTLPIYAFLLLLEAILVTPVVVIAAMFAVLALISILQVIIDWLVPNPEKQTGGRLMGIRKGIHRGQRMLMHPNLLINLLVWVNPAASNDIFERMGRFLRIATQPSQGAVFAEIRSEYPRDKTIFVVLPMDMTFMKLGKLKESIESQHEQLCELANQSNGQIIPFYAADPRHPDIVERVKNNLAKDKFRGIKIYPNLGYPPNCEKLMAVYEICVEGDFPVMTHCSPGGIWQYGLTYKWRRAYSNPESYLPVLKKFPTLKLCLAHFGGAEEWARHLNRRAVNDPSLEIPWVRTIYEMIDSGVYPNLYTDISYTAFTPKVKGLYIDLFDYLKVMLSNPRVRKHVLFGSDYYMVEQERISEKEASILLRSRLGEDLYKQIAYTNPRQYLGMESP